MGGVTITELIDKMGLRNMTPELETDNVMLVHADVNRPALQLTGFFDHFDKDRVQIIGYVENAYISTLTPQRRREMFDKLLSSGIPCLVYSRGMAPEEEVLELCNHYGVPCMVSEKTTSDLMAEIIRWLNVKMAPSNVFLTPSSGHIMVLFFNSGTVICCCAAPVERKL